MRQTWLPSLEWEFATFTVAAILLLGVVLWWVRANLSKDATPVFRPLALTFFAAFFTCSAFAAVRAIQVWGTPEDAAFWRPTLSLCVNGGFYLIAASFGGWLFRRD